MGTRVIGNVVFEVNDVPIDTLYLIGMHEGSWYEAQDMVRKGMVGRRDWKHFQMFWHWSAYKFSSSHQERLFNKRGSEFCKRRILRIKALRMRYLESLVKPYEIKGETK